MSIEQYVITGKNCTSWQATYFYINYSLPVHFYINRTCLDVYPTFKFLGQIMSNPHLPLALSRQVPATTAKPVAAQCLGQLLSEATCDTRQWWWKSLAPLSGWCCNNILLKWLWCIFFFVVPHMFFVTFDFGTLLLMFVSQDDFDVELTWRVAVVGSTATGKSSLVRRFCGRSPNLKQLREFGGRESE